ncbi:MAG TPA: prepilin-type N-terminal cleavage/methylation domain-containing protein [Proteobacteria bacterium]|nr:prepilin-type N-terminal cleavage/methylation domain-containing protein [Pseudomonadota bacterium]
MNLRGIKKCRHLLSEKGFTLVELMIVVALLAILGGIANLLMPPMLSNYYLTAAIKQLSLDLMVCRERAISEGTQFRVTFDVANNCYHIDRWTETAPPGSGIWTWTNPDNAVDPNPLTVSVVPSGGQGYGIQFGASVVDGSVIEFAPRGITTFTGANYSNAPGISITNGSKTGSFTVSFTGKIGAITWS